MYERYDAMYEVMKDAQITTCKFAIILIFLFISIAKPSKASDKYNALIWNLKNYEAGNGKIDKSDWFEWWYYKLTVPNTDVAFYFVYGIINPWDFDGTNKASRAYVSVGNFESKEIIQKDFLVSDFSASYLETNVNIGNNHATANNIKGSLTDERGNNVQYNLDIKQDWSFNAMGWAMSYWGILNIYWYPAQASATMSGYINFNGKHYSFENVPAYQDRNWGGSFPKWWTWMVSNEFENSPGTVLTVGGGKPKLFDICAPLQSVNIGLRYKGETYTWRKNDGDSIDININFGTWEATAKNSKNKIEISGSAPKEKFMDLEFMTPQGDIFHDLEALTGDITVRLYKKTGFIITKWVLLDELFTNSGGLEFGSTDINLYNKIKSDVFRNH